RRATPESAQACSMTPAIFCRWARDASSGTMPLYLRCRWSWEETTFESSDRRSSTTAAAVSSHEVSMPRTVRGLAIPGSALLDLQRAEHVARLEQLLRA